MTVPQASVLFGASCVALLVACAAYYASPVRQRGGRRTVSDQGRPRMPPHDR